MRKWIPTVLALFFAACAFHSSEPTEVQKTPFPVVSVTDTFSWFGKTADDLGIGEANSGSYNEIVFSGDLFGHTVTGFAYTLTDFSEPTMPERINKIFLTDDIRYMQATEAGLKALCGEPYATDIEPYVESKGGATYWQYYWTGEAVVSLSNGAKHDYYTLTCSVPNDVPEQIQKLLAGLTTEELGYRTGVYFKFDKDAVADLHIDPIDYEGYEAYLIVFSREGVPYRVTLVKGGAARYDAMLTDGREGSSDVSGLASFRYRIDENGRAALVEKNAFGDLWIIETDGPVTEEALLALEAFLLNSWLY